MQVTKCRSHLWKAEKMNGMKMLGQILKTTENSFKTVSV